MMTSTSFAAVAFAAWGSTSFAPPASNPTHASTQMVGGKVQFENDNYRITAGDDNSVNIFNKNTGETYHVWGDPHVNIDGKHTFDFWGTTTFQLDDGTKVTINTTPWKNDPSQTLSSKVTITNGDYGVQITGVDTNTTGDLAFEEAAGLGQLADWAVADGNTIHENPTGRGFLGMDARGQLRAVDQQYINETDLAKGGAAMAQRAADAFRQMAGLLAISFVGSFLQGLAQGLDSDSDSGRPAPGTGLAVNADASADFAVVFTAGNLNGNWFIAAAAHANA
jgi:hypothetical protein